MGLDEQGVLLRIQAAGNVLGQLGESAPAQVSGGLPHRDGVHIGHKIIAVKLFGPRAPVFDGAQVVAQVQVAAGLNAREHNFLFGFFHNKTQPFQGNPYMQNDTNTA